MVASLAFFLFIPWRVGAERRALVDQTDPLARAALRLNDSEVDVANSF
jgi:hypothetical protein